MEEDQPIRSWSGRPITSDREIACYDAYYSWYDTTEIPDLTDQCLKDSLIWYYCFSHERPGYYGPMMIEEARKRGMTDILAILALAGKGHVVS